MPQSVVRKTVAATIAVVVMSSAVSIALPISATPARAAAPPPGVLVPSAANIGWTPGQFAVSDDGAAQFSVPLWMPQGRGAITPQLALAYHSRAGNGPLGVGWSLSGLSSITWCPRTYAQDGYVEGVRFDGTSALCLGGIRLMPQGPAGSAQREYRTEQDMFAKIVAFGAGDNKPDYFRAWTRDGLILTFGQTPDARLEAFRLRQQAGSGSELERESTTTRVTAAWAVNLIEDRNGNAATVGYDRLEGDQAHLWSVELRPRTVRYPPNRIVEFQYEARSDVIDGFNGGIHTRIGTRLSRITMSGGPQGGTAELLRDYRLAYQNTSLTGRSLLRTVTERDGAGVAKLPLEFTWSQGSTAFTAITTDVRLPQDTRLTTVDINGDGNDDLLYPDADNVWQLRRGTGSGFAAPVPAGIPAIEDDRRAAIQPVDFDVDGRTDVLAEVPDTSLGGTGWKLFRSNGTTFTAYADNIGFFGNSDHQLDPVYFADIDGNGMPDLVTARLDVGPGEDGPPFEIDGNWRYRLNDGTESGGRFQPEVTTGVRTPDRPGQLRVTDFDGDGRQELVGFNTGPNGYFSLGLNAQGQVEVTDLGANNLLAGWTKADVNGDQLNDGLFLPLNAPHLPMNASINSGNGGQNGSRFDVAMPRGSITRITDFTNDGADDVVVLRSGTPSGPADQERGVQLYTWRPGGFQRIPVNQGLGEPWEDTELTPPQLLDVDGDGVQDIVYMAFVGVDDGWRLRILKRTAGPPDELMNAGVSPTGRRVQLDYTTLANRTVHTPGSCAYPTNCPVKGRRVVAQHRFATGMTGEAAWNRFNHTYAEARTDLHGRGWLGFARHTVTDAQTGTQTDNSFDNNIRGVHRSLEYAAVESYSFARRSKSTTVTVVDRPGGRQYRRSVNRIFQFKMIGEGNYIVEPRIVTETEQERPVGQLAWPTLRTTTTTTTYDNFGNADLVVSSTTGGRKHTEDPTFRNDVANWLIGLPTRTLSTGCTAGDQECRTRETTTEYDQRGNPTVVVVEPQRPESRLRTETAYGQFGAVASVTRTDVGGQPRVDAFEYDADWLHPTATVNPLGHRSLTQTHSGLGVTLGRTDPNGVLTTTSYDRFGRLRETNRSDGGFERITHANVLGFQFTTTTVAGGGTGTTVLDALGREVQRAVTAFDGRQATTYTTYDRFGRTRTVSRPMLPGETRQDTLTEYDNRDRVLSVTAPDGARVRHEYVNLETHTYDARNAHTRTVTGVDGDTIASYEDGPAGTGTLSTTFAYGPFGETVTVVAADTTTQRFTYDLLGNPRTHADPSAGLTTTLYNAYGELTSRTNGANETTSYDYDKLGRIVRATSPDGVVVNRWDNAPNGLGKLANSTSADGTATVYRYDTLSRPTRTTWTVDGTNYQFDYTYDEVGRSASITYPAIPGAPETARLKTANVYTASGYLSQIRDATADTLYYQVDGRDAAGQLTKDRYGNGVTTNRAYLPATGLPQRIATTGPDGTTTLDDRAYEYDLNRNVTRRADAVHGRNERLGYDPLNRLTTWAAADGTVSLQATYAYDKVGNLASETVTGVPDQNVSYAYGENGAPPHALTGRNAFHRYTYDGAGRQLGGPNRHVTYTSFDLPRRITTDNGREIDFRYDAAGERVSKRDPAVQTTVTVGGLFERRIPASPAGTEIHNLHNIVADGRVVAQVDRVQAATGGPVTGSQTLYLHTDAQGSTTLVTNPAGKAYGGEDAVFDGMFYDPWGRRIDDAFQQVPNNRTGGPRQLFTGHYHDDEIYLINMKGRMYDPHARRFLSPDPVTTDPLNSQAHNRYSYVRNNPATYTDPTGFIITDDPGDTRGGGGGRGSFGPGFSALGYPSGGPVGGSIGWSGPLDAPLVTHAPDMTTTLSVGGADDESTQTPTEKLDDGREAAGTIVDALGFLPLNGVIDTVVSFIDTLLDAMGPDPSGPGSTGDFGTDLANAVGGLFTLAEAWIAWNTMANVALRGMSVTAAAALATAEYAGIALLATVGEAIGVLVGMVVLGAWLCDMPVDEFVGQGMIVYNQAETDGWIAIGEGLINGGQAVIETIGDFATSTWDSLVNRADTPVPNSLHQQEYNQRLRDNGIDPTDADVWMDFVGQP